MFVATFFLALVLTLIVSVPNDWARRHAADGVTGVTTIVNVVGVAAIVLLCIKTGLANDVLSVVALILGIAVAGVGANAVATRVWGRPRVA